MSKKKAAEGVKWTSIATVYKAILQLLLLAIVARFLSAEAIGLYALMQFVLAFCILCVDAGLGQSIIHKQESDKKRLSELGFVNFALSIGLCATLWTAAPFIANSLNSPSLVAMLQAVSFVLVILGFSRINFALVQQDLEFNKLAIAEVISSSVTFVTSVYLVVELNMGVFGLVYGFLLGQSVLSFCYFNITRYRLFFSIPSSFSQLRSYFSYGAYQTGGSIVNFFNSQLDVVIIGKTLGMDVLGGYNLVKQFCFKPAMVINPVLTRIAFPYMSKIQHSENLSPTYQNMLRLLSSVNFPIYVMIVVFAEPIVLLLFGETWSNLIPIMQLMAMWCLVRSLINPVGSLLMAIGRVKLALNWNLALLLVFPVGIYLGTRFELLGVAVALLVMQSVVLVAHWFFLLKPTINMSLAKFSQSFFAPLFVAFLSGVAASFCLAVIDTQSFLYQLLMGSLTGGVVYILGTLTFNRQLLTMIKKSRQTD